MIERVIVTRGRAASPATLRLRLKRFYSGKARATTHKHFFIFFDSLKKLKITLIQAACAARVQWVFNVKVSILRSLLAEG